MTTESVIYFQERKQESTVTYAIIWQRWDGELEGVGCWLAGFLKKVLLVSFMEIGPEAEEEENRIVCHGFGDLVTRFIRKYNQDKPSDFRVIHPASVMLDDAEFTYFVLNTDKGIRVQVKGCMDGYEVAVVSERLTAEISIDEFLKLCDPNGKFGLSVIRGPSCFGYKHHAIMKEVIIERVVAKLAMDQKC